MGLADPNLRPKTEDITLKAIGATRVKLTIEFNHDKKKYELKKEDEDVLWVYNIDLNKLKITLQRIEGNQSLRPFDHNQPIWRWLGIKIFTILVLIIYLYVSLLILQMALFNLILVGIVFVYFNKLWTMMTALELGIDYRYRTGGYKRFIEAENLKYYRS